MKERVFELLRAIPTGRVATYGQIAEQLGNKRLARAVGNILHRNPDPANFPCHRVVNAGGRVSRAYAFGGETAQRQRLQSEGVVFESDGRIDLSRYGWTPDASGPDSANEKM